jgi:hypothetical protein
MRVSGDSRSNRSLGLTKIRNAKDVLLDSVTDIQVTNQLRGRN